MANHKEFESWCETTGHDYCFDLNQSGKYQWADAQGAYEAFCYGLSQQHTMEPKRQWVGLTDEKKQQCIYGKQGLVLDYEDVVDTVEAKLKELNT